MQVLKDSTLEEIYGRNSIRSQIKGGADEMETRVTVSLRDKLLKTIRQLKLITYLFSCTSDCAGTVLPRFSATKSSHAHDYDGSYAH